LGGKRGRRVDRSSKLSALKLIEQARKSQCRIKLACVDLEINFKTYQRWKLNTSDKRAGPISTPKSKLTDEQREEVVAVATSKEYRDDSPWVIVAKLADKGIYIASESTFYKILKQRSLLSHRGKSKPGTRKRPEPLVATASNQVWSWDITYLKSNVRGVYFYLYLFLDIFSRKIVGFDVYELESMENSSLCFERICFSEKIIKDQLTLHADNGGAMKGATMLATLEKLGVVPSFSRPRVSDDNPYSESLFKTLKYRPKYPDTFSSIEDAKRWVIRFVDWYNNEHHHSGIKFVTPSQKHQGLDVKILSKRKAVYLKAKKKFPNRWGGRKIRNWSPIEEVQLNCLQRKKYGDIKVAS